MGTIFQVNESNGNVTITGAVDVGSHQIHSVTDPTSAQDAATKNYVDTVAQGITWKQAVAAATVTVLPFSPTYSNGSSGVGATLTATAFGALVIDGYTVLLNDRVLVQNQASSFQNGIYTQTTLGTGSVDYVLTRATDSNTPSEVQAGTATFVQNGTVNADSGFVQTTTGTITIGVTALVFTQFTGLGEVTAGTGLTKSGNTISLITPVTISSGGTNSTTALSNGFLIVSSGGKIVESAITSSTTGSGNVVLAGSPTLTGTLTVPTIDVTSTTNQLVLGTTNTVTISSTAPSASRTYTLPDAGAASNFVLDQGNYTIGGTWTFNNSITLASSKALVLTDNTTDTVSIKATNGTTTYTLSLPNTAGTNGFFLQTDGSGNTSWQAGGSGTVSSGTTGNVAYYTGSTTVGSSTITNTQLTYLPNLFSYRRPVLQYNSSTIVNVETGLDGTSGDGVILFPDGQLRTDSSTTRIQCTLSQNAVFNNATRGNNQGGLDTGTVTSNTWYSFYAVKVTTFSTDWVLIASLTTPTQNNFSTLNSNFGTNGWVYLGTVPYGDDSGSVNAIPRFTMAGNTVYLTNVAVGSANAALYGLKMATTAGATSLTYTHTTGTDLGSQQVPSQIPSAALLVAMALATSFQVSDAAGTLNIIDAGTFTNHLQIWQIPTLSLTLGAKVVPNASTAIDVFIVSYVDGVLGIGSNPRL